MISCHKCSSADRLSDWLCLLMNLPQITVWDIILPPFSCNFFSFLLLAVAFLKSPLQLWTNSNCSNSNNNSLHSFIVLPLREIEGRGRECGKVGPLLLQATEMFSGFNGCFTSLSACKMFSGQSLVYGRFKFWSKQELSDIRYKNYYYTLNSINCLIVTLKNSLSVNVLINNMYI